MISDKARDILETEFVDAAGGLADVLDALTEICRAKSEHLQTNWQDSLAAEIWDARADHIDSCR